MIDVCSAYSTLRSWMRQSEERTGRLSRLPCGRQTCKGSSHVDIFMSCDCVRALNLEASHWQPSFVKPIVPPQLEEGLNGKDVDPSVWKICWTI